MGLKIATCLACGRRTLKRESGPFTFKVRGRELTVPDLPRRRCTSCGETFFDRESHGVLDSRRRPRTRGATAAATSRGRPGPAPRGNGSPT
ncbi:MAG: YgiT-type zinc finger protein [Deltaproteobacteria bacterium]|nr:YgiT-type zinc finger protein [Deltaproteobacteria bacterium]